MSGKYYKDENFKCVRLNGAEQLSKHHCFGIIQYHEENEKLLEEANLYFEYYKNIIHNHSWKGLELKIQRSNGNITKTNIHKDSCVILFNDLIMFYVEFIENGMEYNKLIPLTDYYSKNRNTTDKGILTLNPEFKDRELILYIDNHPEWMDTYRKEWIKKFTDKFESTGINFRFEYK